MPASSEATTSFANTPDKLYPYILEIEFLLDLDHIRDDQITESMIPSSKNHSKRSALIELRKRLLSLKQEMKKSATYIDGLIDGKACIEQEDVSLIISIYEILWADGELIGQDASIWLTRLTSLKQLDTNLGNPFRHLHWRIVRQAQILRGFARWQVNSEWQNSIDVSHESIIIPDARGIAHAWEMWFHSPIQKADAYKRAEDLFIESLRKVGVTSSYYYSAVEAIDLLGRFNPFLSKRSRISYWDVKLASRDNDIAGMLSDTLNSVAYQKSFRSDSQQEKKLYKLFRHQMLCERIALRYWQLDGFVRTIGTYSKATFDTARELLLASPEISLDHFEQSDNSIQLTEENADCGRNELDKEPRDALSLIMLSMYCAAWSWPYGLVSHKTLSQVWPGVENLIITRFKVEVVKKAVDDLILHNEDIPDTIYYRNTFLMSLVRLLTEKHLKEIDRFTNIAVQDRAFMGDPTDDLCKFWTRYVSNSEPGSAITKSAIRLIEILLLELTEQDIRHAESLIARTLIVASPEDADTLLTTLIECLEQLNVAPSNNRNAFRIMFNAIAEGLNNKSDIDKLDRRHFEKLQQIIEKTQKEIASWQGTKYAAALLGGHKPSREEDVAYVEDIVAHIEKTVSIATQTNRNHWSIGHKAFPFNRPCKRVAGSVHITAVIDSIVKLADAKEPTCEEIEGVFTSVGQFMRATEINDREQLIQSIRDFIAKPRLCNEHSLPFTAQTHRTADGSLLALTSVSDALEILEDVEICTLCMALAQRSNLSIVQNIRHCAGVLSASAVRQLGPENGEWAMRRIMTMLFRWARMSEGDQYDLLRGLLSAIPAKAGTSGLPIIFDVFYAWFLSVRSNLDWIHTSIIAYHTGRLSSSISNLPHLNDMRRICSADPRSSIIASIRSGGCAAHQSTSNL